MPDGQGADARRDAIPGQIVRLWGPGAQALDPENQVRILEGQLDRLVRRGCDVRSLYRSTCLKKSLNSALNRSASSTNRAWLASSNNSNRDPRIRRCMSSWFLRARSPP